MPTYMRFEELPVWQSAVELYAGIDELLSGAPTRLSRSFRDQLERATLSISNNIAEGFERGTTKELLTFIYIARGSSGEVRSMLSILGKCPWITPQHSERIQELRLLAESCARQLRAWADSLQNSSITGSRHQNEKARVAYQEQQSRSSEPRQRKPLPSG